MWSSAVADSLRHRASDGASSDGMVKHVHKVSPVHSESCGTMAICFSPSQKEPQYDGLFPNCRFRGSCCNNFERLTKPCKPQTGSLLVWAGRYGRLLSGYDPWRQSDDHRGLSEQWIGRERAQRSQKVLDRKTKLKIISLLSFILFRPLCSFAAINPSAIRQDVFFDFIFLGTEVDEQIGKVFAQRHAVFVEYSDWRLLFDTIALLVKVKAGLTNDVAESHDFIGSFISHSLVPL